MCRCRITTQSFSQHGRCLRLTPRRAERCIGCKRTPGDRWRLPTIYVAPKLSAAVNLSMTYVPSLAVLTAISTNPVPGESDNAVIAWTVAYARAKERDDRAPDAGWLAIYGSEKQNILVSLSPRQTQEPVVATAMFEELWG